MPDEVEPLEGAVTEADPGYDGDIAAAGEVFEDEGGDQPPARQYVEVDDPDQRYVRVKVDGEDVEVPFSEAVRGYSREADYTRKAQLVAQQRQEAELGLRIQQALQADPHATIRLLSERYAAQQAKQPEPEFDDPLERQLHEERQARTALEERINQREADEQLGRTVQDLKSQFGANDEDIRAAVNLAYQNNLGIEALPMVYKTMAFDRIQANVKAYQAQEAAKAAENARRTSAKQAAGQVVSSGQTGATNLTDRANTGAPMSLRESIEAAFEQAGM